MQQDENFDPVQAERNEIRQMLQKGVEFKVPTKNFWGKPIEKVFTVQQPTLRTLIKLNEIYLEMKFSEEELKEDWMNISKQSVLRNAKFISKVAAVAVLNSNHSTERDVQKLADFFLDNVTPQKLFQIVGIISQMSNIADFINSIRSLYINARMTAPNLVEEN
jgi:hypothetical protein